MDNAHIALAVKATPIGGSACGYQRDLRDVGAKSVRRLPKAVWAIIIVLISAPRGALIYLFRGRDRGRGAVVAQ